MFLDTIMYMKKDAGIILPIFSLPSKYGIGSFSKEAYEFVDFLNESKMHIWQILPLTVTSFGNSPYQSPSNYGLNYNFIDLETLIKKGLLKEYEVNSINRGEDESRVDYGAIFNNKLKVLRLAYSRFDKNNCGFKEFLTKETNFSDFSVFMVLKEHNALKAWYEWKDEEKNYSLEVDNKVKNEFKDEYNFYMWTQFEALEEYLSLKKYANSKGVKIMGDLPIYVAFDSLEVWKYPELFQLDENHYPTRVAGCPPDCFSEDGQLWGNPLYNWEYLKSTDYKWWNDRINNALNLYVLLRIDHFRGFSGYYSIPFKDKTARFGKWVKGPGFDLFKDKLDLPIVAEDLGFIDDDFKELMKLTNYPGMKTLSHGLKHTEIDNILRPRNYTYNFYSYSSTHDNETTLQYIEELNEIKKANFIKVAKEECEYFNIPFKTNPTNKDLVKVVNTLNFANEARCAIFLFQDLIPVGKEGRINSPATLSNLNWSYRISKKVFLDHKEEIIKFLKENAIKYGRN